MIYAFGALALGLLLFAAVVYGCTRERIDIHDENGDSTVYLRRWILWGRRSSQGGKDRRALMLHCMYRPDADRCHHDHPWGFWTLVLWGGYVEEVTREHPGEKDGNWRGGPIKVRNRMWVGKLAWRPATYTHRIAELPNGPAYTLVLRTPYVRRWGFHTPHGWVYFRDAAGKLVEWCRS